VATGRPLSTFRGHTRHIEDASFDPGGDRVISASWDETAKVWERESGRVLFDLVGHRTAVWCAAFSNDGAWAATGAGDGSVKLWELSTGQELRSFRAHAGPIRSIAFSRDDQALVTGSQDGTVRIWQVARERPSDQQIAEAIECDIPYILVNGIAVPRNAAPPGECNSRRKGT
jgi:WD40 repeat protein